MLWQRGFCAVLFCILLLAGSPYKSASAQEQPVSPEYDPTQVTLPEQTPSAILGRALFAENCAPCHGAEGNSDGPVTPNLPAPPPKLTDPQTSWQRSPAEYFHIVKYGRIGQMMPPWSNRLDDEQIWQAAYYAWSLHTSQEAVEAGRQLYEAALPNADESQKAELDGLLTAHALPFTTQAELADTLQSTLPGAADWSDAERQSVLDYLRTFSYIAPWDSAYRPGAGQVQGRVQLHPADGSAPGPVANLPVTMTAYLEITPIATFTTTTDTDGLFQFGDLSTASGIVYIARAPYMDVAYESGIIQLTDAQPEANTPILVYETSDDPSGLRISRANWVVDYKPGELVVGLILAMGNDNAATFVGQAVDGVDQPVTTQFLLPEGADDVQFQGGVEGGRFLVVDRHVYDLAPVAPGAGTQQLFLSYRMPYEGEQIEFAQEFLYPIDQLNLLVADLPALEVQAPDLSFIGDDALQGLSYQLWGGQNLTPQSFDVTLTGLIPPGGIDPRQAAAPAGAVAEGEQAATADSRVAVATTTPPLEPIVAFSIGGGLLLALIGASIWPLRRMGNQSRREALVEEKAALLQRIAELDDDAAAAKIEQTLWIRERAQLKRRLLDLAQQLSELDDKNVRSTAN